MKKFILRGQLLDGSIEEFEFHEIQSVFRFSDRDVTYIRYRGANYPVKSETIEFLEVK